MLLPDAQIWFNLGPLQWAQTGVMVLGLLGIGAAGVLFSVACLWAGVSKGGSARERLTSFALGIGAGALVAWGGSSFGGQLLNPLLGLKDDFAGVRLEGSELVLVAGTGADTRRPAEELENITLGCEAHQVSGEEEWRCLRSVSLSWRDGSAATNADVVPGGWHACPDALTQPRADARALLGAAGRPEALTITGDCGAP